jgi:hypothetical protein
MRRTTVKFSSPLVQIGSVDCRASSLLTTLRISACWNVAELALSLRKKHAPLSLFKMDAI